MEHTEGAGQPGDARAAEKHPHPVGAGPTTPPNTPDRLVYLDHAATAPMLPDAVAAMTEELAHLGNPSSLHNAGRRARRVVEESREQIAEAFSARPSEVIFTSGGTEADNLAVKGLFWTRRSDDPQRRRVLITATEHHAVLDSANWLASHEGAEITWLAVDGTGLVSADTLRAAIEADLDSVALVSVLWANTRRSQPSTRSRSTRTRCRPPRRYRCISPTAARTLSRLPGTSSAGRW